MADRNAHNCAQSLCLVLGVLAAGCGGPPEKALALATDPGLIEMSLETTRSLVPAERESQLAIRVRIHADQLPTKSRPPLNLAVVIDTSSSMEGDAIAAARNAATSIVDQLRDGDRISVIGFGSEPVVLVESTELSPALRTVLQNKIERLRAHGTTDLTGGLARGLAELSRGRAAGTISRVVLLSDGIPNDFTQLPQLTQQALAMQAPITALGLGIDFDEVMLGQLATETGGVYRYLEKADVVAKVFEEEVLRLQNLVGRNLVVTLKAGPGVRIEDIPGFPLSGDHNVRNARIGDLAAGEIRDLIVPIEVAGRLDGSTVELMDAKLQFEDVIGRSGTQQRTGFVAAKSSGDEEALSKASKVDVELAVERAAAAGAILRAIELARSGQLDAGKLVLAEAEAKAREAADKFADKDLRELAERIHELGPNLRTVVPQPTAANRYPTPAPDSVNEAPAPAAAEAELEDDFASEAPKARAKRKTSVKESYSQAMESLH